MLFSKYHFFILKIKRNIFSIIFLCFSLSLLIFSKSNLSSAKNALILWASSVVPSLFPFFVASELLMYTNIINILGRYFTKIMRPLFNVGGEGSLAFILGLISGYPVGAKIACNLRENDICSKEECERLLSFTNNSGPLFIVGTVGISMFGNSTIGTLLLITHILASITVGMIFRFWKNNKRSCVNKIEDNKYKNVTISNLGDVLGKSITSSISTILMIGGFIVVFSTIISILKSSGILYAIITILTPFFKIIKINPDIISGFIIGLLEITNGISVISNIHIKNISVNIAFSSFLLGCGGISILFQILSITSKTDLSIKPYIYGKLLHGVISALYVLIFINFFPFFNFNL